MPITTYSELKAAVADWLNRTDLTARVPDFIALAEAEINRKVRVLSMEHWAQYDSDLAMQFLPGDNNEFLELKRARVSVAGRPRPIPVLSTEQAEVLMTKLNTVGSPQAVCFEGNRMRVIPTPDGTYSWDLIYYKRVPALTDANPTGTILTLHPDLYLYGALQHSAPFLRDDERVPIWGSKFGAILAELGSQDERTVFATSTLRTRATPIG